MSKFVVSRVVAVAAAMLALGFAGRVMAQRTDPKERPDDRGKETREAADPAVQPGQINQVDRMVANQLLEMSQGEIELANFALKHSQNEEIRKFAQMMIQDHTNLNNQLERFASPGLIRTADRPASPQLESTTGPQPGPTTEQPAAPPAQPGTTAAAPDRPAVNPTQPIPGEPGARDAAHEGMFVQVCQDVSQQIGAGIQRELGQFQGADFDRAYLGQQFWGHVVFIATAQGAGKHVSPELKQVVDQGATTADKHLADCRKLIRDLSANIARGQGNETTPRR